MFHRICSKILRDRNSVYIQQWLAKPEDFTSENVYILALDLAAGCEIVVPINFQ